MYVVMCHFFGCPHLTLCEFPFVEERRDIHGDTFWHNVRYQEPFVCQDYIASLEVVK